MAGEVARAGRGLLFILIGPGGVGKNTLMQAVMPRFDGLTQLATATTRAIRPNETPGVHHLFISRDEFEGMIAQDALVEYEEVHPGKYYGVPRAPLERAIAEGHDLIADVEISGAEKVRAEYPDHTVLIFIRPPSLEVLAERMRARGESEAGVHERMERAAREMAFIDRSDYVIENDEGAFEAAAEALYQAILTERNKRDQMALAEQMQSESIVLTAGGQ